MTMKSARIVLIFGLSFTSFPLASVSTMLALMCDTCGQQGKHQHLSGTCIEQGGGGRGHVGGGNLWTFENVKADFKIFKAHLMITKAFKPI